MNGQVHTTPGQRGLHVFQSIQVTYTPGSIPPFPMSFTSSIPRHQDLRAALGDERDDEVGGASLSQHPKSTSVLGDDKGDEKGDDSLPQHQATGNITVSGDESLERMLKDVLRREISEKSGDEGDESLERMLRTEIKREMRNNSEGDESLERMLEAVATREAREKDGDEGDRSLGRMLEAVVKREMSGCNLVIAFDSAYDNPLVLAPLLALPNPRQVR